MRLRDSKEVEKLYTLIKPYLETDIRKIIAKNSSLKDNAPDNIKEAYNKWKFLSDKEYREAMGY